MQVCQCPTDDNYKFKKDFPARVPYQPSRFGKRGQTENGLEEPSN